MLSLWHCRFGRAYSYVRAHIQEVMPGNRSADPTLFDDIFHQYHFVGIAERFDESLVCAVCWLPPERNCVHARQHETRCDAQRTAAVSVWSHAPGCV